MLNAKGGGWSEEFPRTGCFILGRDGTGAWHVSRVVRVTRNTEFPTGWVSFSSIRRKCVFFNGINIIGNKSREKNELGHRRRTWSCENYLF